MHYSKRRVHDLEAGTPQSSLHQAMSYAAEAAHRLIGYAGVGYSDDDLADIANDLRVAATFVDAARSSFGDDA